MTFFQFQKILSVVVLRQTYHRNINLFNAKSNRMPINRKLLKFTIFGISGITGYDAFNEFHYFGATTRFLRCLKIAVSISLDYKLSLRGLEENSKEYDKVMKEVNLRSAKKILEGCLANGGLYIKGGQGVSSINHILPKEYTETLKQLENECLARKPNEVKRLFLQDFGKTPDEMFETFDYKPIAAASLAQVFKATTKDDQKPVAVKVQYIDLNRRFIGDFGTILFIQNLVKLVHKQYNFSWILIDLKANLKQEFDFINEGKNGERCANELKKFKYVHIPKVYWNLTSTRVLTTEWIDGYKISDITKIKNDGFKIEDIDKKLLNIFGEQIFSTGFVHADPHPGNVFLRKSKKGQPEIILLDHGLYEYLSEPIRHSLCKFWEAIVLKDLQMMKKYSKELNVDDCEKFAEILLQRPFSISARNLTTKLTAKDLAYMQEMAKNRFDIILETLSQMPRNMIFIIRNLNTVRAIARNHGDPIDRPAYMAKYAQKCIYNYEKSSIATIKWIWRRLRFEYHLLKSTMVFWFIRSYLHVLTILKRSPDTSSLFTNYEVE